MLTKTQVVDAIEQMPEQFSLDLLFDRLLFVSKVEKGLSQSAAGKINSQEQARQKLSRWCK